MNGAFRPLAKIMKMCAAGENSLIEGIPDTHLPNRLSLLRDAFPGKPARWRMDASYEVFYILRALPQIADDEIVNWVIWLTHDENAAVREQAVVALAFVGNRAAIPRLRAMGAGRNGKGDPTVEAHYARDAADVIEGKRAILETETISNWMGAGRLTHLVSL